MALCGVFMVLLFVLILSLAGLIISGNGNPHTMKTDCTDCHLRAPSSEEAGTNLFVTDIETLCLRCHVGVKVTMSHPIGVKPMYYGFDQKGRMYFSSEMKAIHDYVIKPEAFPPGYYYTPETGFVRYFKPRWEDAGIAVESYDPVRLRKALISSVEKRLMSDVPLGVLLSGGLDSSLVASITKRLMEASGRSLHSFSVGISKDAPDMVAAREVAAFLGTIHHEVVFTIKEGLEALEKVIWHLETYDVTTVRAATPMYFLSKAIREAGIKVVLSGEGSDEIFGGYLYFHNAPSDEEFQKETIRRVLRLSTADCLRADKSTMAHGIEARVPFLDLKFLETAISIRPEEKRP